MGRPEGVVFAFRTLGEAAQAAALTQGADPVASSREDLVRIGLMADVPDDAIRRRVEHIVQRDSQLDHPEARAQMPAGHRHRADGLGAQFICDLTEIALVHPAQIGGRVDLIQERRERLCHFIPEARPVLWPRRQRHVYQRSGLPQLHHSATLPRERSVQGNRFANLVLNAPHGQRLPILTRRGRSKHAFDRGRADSALSVCFNRLFRVPDGRFAPGGRSPPVLEPSSGQARMLLPR